MADLPWYKYYPTLFDADTALLSNQAVGGWQRLLNYMYPKEIDTIQGNYEFFGRLMRCQMDDAKDIIDELEDQEICDIRLGDNTTITLTSRRIKKENNKKECNRIRQQRMRDKGGGNPERWTAIRVKILERDDYVCQYCGKKAQTVDHIKPKSKGGTEADKNLVACCKGCNNIKNNRNLKEANMSFWKHATFKNNTNLTGERLDVRGYIKKDYKEKKKINKKESQITLPDFIDNSLFKSYLQSRKKKPSDNTLQMIISKLTNWHNDNQDVNAIIEQSIINGWTGLFPLKDNNKPKQHEAARLGAYEEVTPEESERIDAKNKANLDEFMADDGAERLSTL